MTWEHFDNRENGDCRLQKIGEFSTLDARYAMGFLLTGKQRVFWGYRLIITLADREFVAKSKGCSESYLPVLTVATEILAAEKLLLLVVGNAPSYTESAMSGRGGRGYVDGCKSALGIMSEYPCPVSESPK